MLLHETLGIKGRTLSDEIDTLLKDGNLPSGLHDSWMQFAILATLLPIL